MCSTRSFTKFVISLSSQQEARGLKNPEAVKAKQKRREEAEKKARAAGATGDSALKVG